MAVPYHKDEFKVVRQKPVLVIPAEPTPKHVVLLPHVNVYSVPRLGNVYKFHTHMFKADAYDTEVELAQIIRHALEKILVTYYPFAGRVRVTKHGNLEVVCTAQGVVFVEAHANATLSELSRLDHSAWEHLRHNVPFEKFVDVTPLVVQVTALLCGSFVLTLGVLEYLSDLDATLQFINEWMEIARGEKRVSIHPVRDAKEIAPVGKAGHPADGYDTYGLRDPGVTTSLSRFMQQDPSGKKEYADKEFIAHLEWSIELGERVCRLKESSARYREPMSRKHIVSYDPVPVFASITLFDIPIESIVSLKKRLLMEGISKFTLFEALAAHVWRERTRVLRLSMSHEVKLFFLSDACNKGQTSDLPTAIYAQHAFNCEAAMSAGELVEQPLSYAVERIQAAKEALERRFARCVDGIEDAFRMGGRNAGILFFTEFSKMKTQVMGSVVGDFGWGAGGGGGELSAVNTAGLMRKSMDYDSIYLLMNNVPVTSVEDLKFGIVGGGGGQYVKTDAVCKL